MNDAAIAEKIKSYWRNRGYDVDVGVFECEYETSHGSVQKYHTVRSDTVNGLPPRFRGERDIACSTRRRP